MFLCVFVAPPSYAECVLGQSEMVYVQWYMFLCVCVAPPSYAECVLGQSEMVHVQ